MLCDLIGIDPTNLRLGVVLPVGISFYTFQSLSYTIDVYRKRIAPTSHFWDFCAVRRLFSAVGGRSYRARLAPVAATHQAAPHPSCPVDGWHRPYPPGPVQEGRYRRRCCTRGRLQCSLRAARFRRPMSRLRLSSSRSRSFVIFLAIQTLHGGSASCSALN